ncbi:MAG: hypothetical protein ACTSRZ_15875 [Promethearchaeota archaeon]
MSNKSVENNNLIDLGEKKENKNQIKDNADEELDSFIGPGAYFHSTRHSRGYIIY